MRCKAWRRIALDFCFFPSSRSGSFGRKQLKNGDALFGCSDRQGISKVKVSTRATKEESGASPRTKLELSSFPSWPSWS